MTADNTESDSDDKLTPAKIIETRNNGDPEERNCCPECDSQSIAARVGGHGGPNTDDPDLPRYRCDYCGNEFETPVRKMGVRRDPQNSDYAKLLMELPPDTPIRAKDDAGGRA